MEKFGLDALEALCGGGSGAVATVLSLYAVETRGGVQGLWMPELTEAQRRMDSATASVVEWHPHGDSSKPALPLPFSAYDLAAFGLAGGGAILSSRFYDCSFIDEDELSELGQNAERLRQLVRRTHGLEQDAYRPQRIEDGRSEEEQPRNAREAAQWLQAEVKRMEAAESIPAASMAARARHPQSVDDDQQTPSVGAETNPPLVADRGRRLKRATLIAENRSRWESIESDLHDAAANGLTTDARDFGGFWWEGSAKAWATARGKLKVKSETVTIHRILG